ncbi:MULTISPECIES: DUF4440 domain-containing protein [unclassified Streptomyces]|uniref:YybH family protein n=1 Tax=unclassified Streptomyces TaxID=2593676 RepID=UPI000DD58E4E|nr:MULTISPECIES: nuclear transport factor 2 family protein [unclassified Streptomyces]QZZ29988.1 nuclear transport factor 2 family protein [Streptomyces sp. ST1015]
MDHTPPYDVRDLPATFQRAFNAKDSAALKDLFTEDAITVLPDRDTQGVPITDLPIALTLREAHTAGDTALLIIDYTHTGTTPDGRPLRFTGTAIDVAHRGADDRWRFRISNPAGLG